MKFRKYTVEELVKLNMLEKPIDGNHGGKHPTSKDYIEKGIPFIMVSDINKGKINYNTCKYISKITRDGLDKGFSKPDDVLLSHKATIGLTAIVGKEFEEIVLTPQLTYYRVKNNINNKYLKYYFDSQYFQNILNNWATSGSTRAYLGITAQLKLPILLPDIDTQNRIAKVLSNIDEKIEINNQINDNLQKISSKLYKHYFVDSNDYEYEERKLSEVASEVITGKTPSTYKDEYWGGNIPFVTIPDMHSDVFTINAERYLTEEGNNSQKKKLLPRNSIMVSCIATVGLVSINSSPSHTNQQINSIIIKNDYDLYFLYENMKTRGDELKGIGASGTSTLNVNKGEFEKLIIKYPTKEVLLNFDKNIRPLFNKMEELQKESIKLEQLRDTLLPRLMNGEIELEGIKI